jgi:HK97 family phage portal protein
MNFFKVVWSRITSPGKYIFGPRRPFWMRSSTVVDVDTSMQVAAFNRGVVYISTQIAKLPWDLKDANNNILRNATSDLLNLCPNPEINAFRWRLFMVQTAIMQGNAYSEIERDGAGRVIALWPLESQRMSLARSASGQLVYVYADPSGGDIYFSPRDIFHLPNFHLSKDCGYIGQGVVAYGRDVLGIQIAADNMAAGIFHNSGIPSGILEHPGKLTDEAYLRLKESWAEQQGGRKTGSTSILEEGMTYKPVQVDAEALQFLESRKFGVLEIARFLGVPPTKLFDVTAATYSNVEQANLEVATDTLDTWATNLEIEADVKILSNRYGGRYTDIDLYSIFRGDMKSRSDYFKTMLSVGAITPNQIRAREGLPGYGKVGDNYYIATNNYTPVDRMDEVIDADIKQKTKPASSPSSPQPKQTDEEKELQQAALRFLTGK